MATTVTIIVVPNLFGISAMTLPTGTIYKFATQRRRRIETLAKRICPERSGDMARSIEGRYKKDDLFAADWDVSANTHYARFVHEGTSGQSGGKRLAGEPGIGSHGRWHPGDVIFFERHTWPEYTKKPIRGINSDPFLSDALESVMADIVGRSGLPGRRLSRATRLL